MRLPHLLFVLACLGRARAFAPPARARAPLRARAAAADVAALPTADDVRAAPDDALDGLSASIWAAIREEAAAAVAPGGASAAVLEPYLARSVAAHASLRHAVAGALADALADDAAGLPRAALFLALGRAIGEPSAARASAADLLAAVEADAAAPSPLTILLHFKGFLALQAHRAAHALWTAAEDGGDAGARQLALLLQGRASARFDVDIHPGARVGAGVFVDHASGVVVGETAHVGPGCVLLHGVTLGATGKRERGTDRRHPKVGARVTIGTGATLLGPIVVGDGAVIGTRAVVTKDVAPGATVIDTTPMKNRVLLPKTPKAVEPDA